MAERPHRSISSNPSHTPTTAWQRWPATRCRSFCRKVVFAMLTKTDTLYNAGCGDDLAPGGIPRTRLDWLCQPEQIEQNQGRASES